MASPKTVQPWIIHESTQKQGILETYPRYNSTGEFLSNNSTLSMIIEHISWNHMNAFSDGIYIVRNGLWCADFALFTPWGLAGKGMHLILSQS